MDKGTVANYISFLIIVFGFAFSNDMILNIGLFAFSGAITNSLAIHMLFEKVPLLYGSGVIENRFESFKISIHNLIIDEFFSKENIDKFFTNELKQNNKIDLQPLLEQTDFTPAFESLKNTVMESSFGNMLGMFGGVSALEPLKEPFINKMKLSVIDISNSKSFQKILQKSLTTNSLNDELFAKINDIVIARLDQLTPKLVKNIISKLIKKHLGWLVVWGAIFGGLIGLVASFFYI
jgi:uncharacterized membrane protein YheB (UPF0754 family)